MGDRDGIGRRVFVAFELDTPCRRALAAVESALKVRLESGAGAGCSLTWVEPSNLHVTIRFLGATPETRLAGLCAAIGRPFTSLSFEVRLDALGVFPGGGPAHTLWAGTSADTPDAAQVCRELDTRLVEWGLAPEERRFRLHVTLARVRRAGRALDLEVIRQFRMDPIGPFQVDRITLFESRLQGHGAVYVPLEYGALGPRPHGRNGGMKGSLR